MLSNTSSKEQFKARNNWQNWNWVIRGRLDCCVVFWTWQKLTTMRMMMLMRKKLKEQLQMRVAKIIMSEGALVKTRKGANENVQAVQGDAQAGN